MKLRDILSFFCIDYNSNNAYVDKSEHLNLVLTPFGGTRISSNEYFQYGTVEVEMMMAKGENVVTAIVLLADNKDEIDYEFVGKDTSIIQSNLYYKGEPIYETNAEYHNTNLDLTTSFNNYTIVWQPGNLRWFINGKLLRRETMFPDTASKLYIGIWGADVSKWGGTGLVFNAVTPNYKSIVKRIEIKKGIENGGTQFKISLFSILLIKFNLFLIYIF